MNESRVTCSNWPNKLEVSGEEQRQSHGSRQPGTGASDHPALLSTLDRDLIIFAPTSIAPSSYP